MVFTKALKNPTQASQRPRATARILRNDDRDDDSNDDSNDDNNDGSNDDSHDDKCLKASRSRSTAHGEHAVRPKGCVASCSVSLSNSTDAYMINVADVVDILGAEN